MRYRVQLSLLFAAVLYAVAAPARAQLSLPAAVDLALRNSPQVKIAQADLAKAKATLAESKDVYIPAVGISGGIGKSAGVPLNLPVIFTISAQSLAFNFSQPDYIRAAHAGVAAVGYALEAARAQVVEDAVVTYVTLDNAQRRRQALAEAAGIANRLQQITEDRYAAGADPHSELTKSKRTGVQLRLQALVVSDEIETLSDHLHHLTGLPTAGILTVHDSIPDFAKADTASLAAAADSYGVRAAYASATSKQYQAHGDRRYKYLPQLAFGAGYSRISTVGTNYAQYYRGFATDDPTNRASANSLNSLDIGIQVNVPILDYLRGAKARESAADAARAFAEAENARMQFGEGQLKLAHARAELLARVELASLDRDLAQDQLDTTLLQLQASAANAAGPALTPKDEQNARLQERERYIDMLNAELLLRQSQVSSMQQEGSMGGWLQQAMPGAGAVVPAAGSAGASSPVRNAPIPAPTPRP